MMIGAREETLGKARSETKEMSSPTNKSMERADLSIEDWIQETCLISAVTSVVEFWGLPPLILFFNVSIGWVLRFVLSTVVNQNKEAWLR